MGKMNKKNIEVGNTVLGIEFGSTRIKSVLIDDKHEVLAIGSYEWENELIDGLWTYKIEDIWKGIQSSYSDLKRNVETQYDLKLKKIGAIGISAMQHGYMVFDKDDNQLVDFRTWRNTVTGDASKFLTELFEYPIPQRWNIAHLYQAITNEEEHVKSIVHLTTLAGYVHWKLTGLKVVGLNEASGMFPIDMDTLKFDKNKIALFDESVSRYNYPWRLDEILPEIVSVNKQAGALTEEGARLLDVTGELSSGSLFCPPEGDGATGMLATNSITPGIGNISAGTSVFAMFVLNEKLKKVHPEVDLVVSPDGNQVGMIHCNNCTSDINAWVKMFYEFSQCLGSDRKIEDIYKILFEEALNGESDGGGLMVFNYLSGEHITGIKEGRPLFIRKSNSALKLSNFMKVHLYSSLATMKIGVNILTQEEKIKITEIVGHGGLFKTELVGQKMVADALELPVKIRANATEGGAWGIALLAAYMKYQKNESLQAYLKEKVFLNQEDKVVYPDVEATLGFERFMKEYIKCIEIEKIAGEIYS